MAGRRLRDHSQEGPVTWQSISLQPVQPHWPGPVLLTQVLFWPVTAKHLVMDWWPLTNLAARMVYNSQSFMICPSFILSFIFTFLCPVAEIIFSTAQWTGGLSSNIAAREGDVWVKPENCSWSCQTKWCCILNIWSRLSKILPAIIPR